jgi:hypothetical protein
VFSAHDAAPVPRAQRLQTALHELEALDAALAAFAEQRGLPLAARHRLGTRATRPGSRMRSLR